MAEGQGFQIKAPLKHLLTLHSQRAQSMPHSLFISPLLRQPHLAAITCSHIHPLYWSMSSELCDDYVLSILSPQTLCEHLIHTMISEAFLLYNSGSQGEVKE